MLSQSWYRLKSQISAVRTLRSIRMQSIFGLRTARMIGIFQRSARLEVSGISTWSERYYSETEQKLDQTRVPINDLPAYVAIVSLDHQKYECKRTELAGEHPRAARKGNGVVRGVLLASAREDEGRMNRFLAQPSNGV